MKSLVLKFVVAITGISLLAPLAVATPAHAAEAGSLWTRACTIGIEVSWTDPGNGITSAVATNNTTGETIVWNNLTTAFTWYGLNPNLTYTFTLYQRDTGIFLGTTVPRSPLPYDDGRTHCETTTVPPSDDDDGDGVNNYFDHCPATAPNTSVDFYGCELDDDNDGIPNNQDQCPYEYGPASNDGCPMQYHLAVINDSNNPIATGAVANSAALCPNDFTIRSSADTSLWTEIVLDEKNNVGTGRFPIGTPRNTQAARRLLAPGGYEGARFQQCFPNSEASMRLTVSAKTPAAMTMQVAQFLLLAGDVDLNSINANLDFFIGTFPELIPPGLLAALNSCLAQDGAAAVLLLQQCEAAAYVNSLLTERPAWENMINVTASRVSLFVDIRRLFEALPQDPVELWQAIGESLAKILFDISNGIENFRIEFYEGQAKRDLRHADADVVAVDRKIDSAEQRQQRLQPKADALSQEVDGLKTTLKAAEQTKREADIQVDGLNYALELCRSGAMACTSAHLRALRESRRAALEVAQDAATLIAKTSAKIRVSAATLERLTSTLKELGQLLETLKADLASATKLAKRARFLVDYLPVVGMFIDGVVQSAESWQRAHDGTLESHIAITSCSADDNRPACVASRPPGNV